MQIKYLPALVTLVAAAVVCIFGVVNSYDVIFLMKTEIITIIVFYIIGRVASKIINNVLMDVPVEEEDTEDNKETEQEENKE